MAKKNVNAESVSTKVNNTKTTTKEKKVVAKEKKTTTPKVEKPKVEKPSAKVAKPTIAKKEKKTTTAKVETPKVETPKKEKKTITKKQTEKAIEVKAKPTAKATLAKVAKTTSSKKTETRGRKSAIGALIAKEVAKKMDRVKNEAKIAHHNACVAVTELQNKTKFPIGVLIYLALGTSAHKLNVFEKGYTSCSTTKANRIIGFCRSVAKALGNPNLAWNDKVVHAMARFDAIYDGNKTKFLKDALAKLKIDDKFKFDFKTSTDLNKFLFAKVAKFNESGRMVAD